MGKLKSTLAIASVSIATALMLSGCAVSNSGGKMEVKKEVADVNLLTTYANIALVNYTDALNDAIRLQMSINSFVKNPNKATLQGAKAAWLASRESYGQTEIFRLSNTPIDAEEGWIAEAYGNLEGQVNAWPLDENLIDYTIDENGKRTSGNIIDSRGEFTPIGEDSKPVNIDQIKVSTITDLNENGGEANVASGYHAIEFLLWGQDQDYENMLKDNVTKGGLVAGERPLSDFTTDKNANRRKAYLKAAADKLVEDLQLVTKAWKVEVSSDCSADSTGCYRGALLGSLKGADESKNIPSKTALKQIFGGMGMFIKSELANERIAVAVLTPSEEDEHSCFSDNTHRDLVTNYQGFKNALMGTYKGINYGSSAYANLDNETKAKVLNLMGSIERKIRSIDVIASNYRHFDYQIHPNDPQAKVIVKLKNELRALGDEMIDIAQQNGVSLSIEDVTDSEETKL